MNQTNDWMAEIYGRWNRDEFVQEETRSVARAVAKSVVELRSGRLQAELPKLTRPRPK